MIWLIIITHLACLYIGFVFGRKVIIHKTMIALQPLSDFLKVLTEDIKRFNEEE